MYELKPQVTNEAVIMFHFFYIPTVLNKGIRKGCREEEYFIFNTSHIHYIYLLRTKSRVKETNENGKEIMNTKRPWFVM